jgi:putative nucleotidyltransferase with HDIG domain
MTVVVDICAAVSVARGIMPPLASLKSHDEYTFVHTINVALLSTALAEEVGMRGDTLLDLTVAAVLHDIGKRMIPKSVLNKEGKLTDDEWKIVQRHPVDGARLLFDAPDIPPIAPIVAYEHHMYPDGGYPRVAGGWKMHLASRIVQVADVFDALRTDRPYRAGMSPQDAIDILQKDAGTRYEHALLDAFIGRVSGNTQRELPEPASDIPRLRSA